MKFNPLAERRLRLDVCCNNPDNGLFAGRAERLNIETWDGESIDFEARSFRAPKFTEFRDSIRLCRRYWKILGSREWFGNWCWNAYWLTPNTCIDLLDTIKKARLFHCDQGPSQLFDNWKDDSAPLDRDLWAANLWGPHSIEVIAERGDA